MEHVVFFTGPDGAAHYRRTPTLDDAVRFVEHLRNAEGVEDPRVFALTEVPLAFKAVYRVEVPGVSEPVAEAPVAEVADVVDPVEEPEPVVAAPEPVDVVEPVEPVAEVPVPEPAEPVLVPEPFAAEVFPAQPEGGSNGKTGRGLGFFTR